MPLTRKSYGSGTAPFSFNCVWPRNGVTTWQIGLPPIVVARCGVDGEALDIPLTVVTDCSIVSDAPAIPGAAMIKQMSGVGRPVSRAPTNAAQNRSHELIPM